MNQETEFLPPFCPFDRCENFLNAPSAPALEFLSIGADRFRCRRCGRLFSEKIFDPAILCPTVKAYVRGTVASRPNQKRAKIGP